MLKQHQFCNYCGGQFHGFLGDLKWPRHCRACGMVTYRNPLPVVVIAVPVLIDPPNPKRAVLAIRRANDPDSGALALVSGYIDYAEHWKLAAIRELKEEVGLDMLSKDLHLMDVDLSKDGSHLLVCCKTTYILGEEVAGLSPEPSEVSEITTISNPDKFRWATHKRIAEEVLNG